MEIEDDVPFMLHPGEFILGSTSERIEIPDDLVARLEGKSSLGRIGLLIHSTAGYVDPGWKGHLTLELTNVSRIPVTLYYGMRIGQISFLRLSTPVDRPTAHRSWAAATRANVMRRPAGLTSTSRRNAVTVEPDARQSCGPQAGGMTGFQQLP